ncbi:uncharacterized protein LOC107620940 [Arachis ipaensis]|uniref:uncharacterized protein LOC107620940 n=1 Tax=Arachis ipaensis TaxID=130454 RepID=UPI0007AF43D0|nr:uncharacterized protein LOC107620940 [Arachis ipaensis]
MANFVVLRDSTAYNIILGRKTINDLGAAISTKLLVMKFITDDGSVGSIRGDLETAVACDHASLSLRKKSKEASGVFLADLDARIDNKPRPEPEGDLEKFRIPMYRPDEDKTAFITPGGIYCYKVMPFGLKTTRPDDLLNDLGGVFASLRQHDMRLNPLKCAFAMEAGKFLGFMITQRGVEANPEKCKAILQMKSPGCIKDVQRLAGRLTALSRFLGASAAKALPFFNLMKKGIAFEWIPACEEAFNHFKEILVAPPVLGKPKAEEPLYLYLAVTEEALAAVLVREEGKAQQPIYFVSRALQGAELRYSKLEKLALALLTSSRRLRQYFQGHRVVVRTDQAIRQVLQKPDLAGRMMTWAIELSQYDLQYEPRHAIKAQVMADFLVEVTGDPHEETGTRWRLHVDGASNQTSGGAGVILESPAGVIYEQSSKFEFPVSNNQAEYEALLVGLTLAREVGVTRLEVCSDSQVVTSQVNGSYQARDPLLQKYLEKVRELTRQFQEVTVQHVSRERNTRADLLSKLASTKPGAGNRSLIQGMVKEPTVALHLTESSPSWLDPITNFFEHGKLPDDEKATKTLRREAAKYAVIQGQLFRKGLSQPLLKWLHPDQMDYVITRFGIPEVVISDNGTQFTDKKFTEFLTGLGIKQKFSSVEHPQMNGQVESANKVILLGLKKRLVNKKGAWADELASVLWSYRTTEQSSTGKTPLSPNVRGRRSNTRGNWRTESTVTSRRSRRSGGKRPGERDQRDDPLVRNSTKTKNSSALQH